MDSFVQRAFQYGKGLFFFQSPSFFLYFNLSIPYDEGYNIYVDGEKVSYEKTNISFIGFEIDKGYHEIKIEYTAPWLNIGKVVSVIGVISFFVVVLVGKGVKKDEKNINDSTLL